ncbi:hypothetical protein FEM48_ZijujUnG0033900 [Ziziphus jujuba var. spinosa]|uniref:Uncharacterized protein n=1 Tax=Ziziphus jujuba var. spinosa TaxID=714518 RepID=A0A978U9F4_ZIZJJ|nr:hypothetical protein FEM48_ZijujUnG0033900 [Ziziphus jujuba var. spinosa]
MGKRLNKLLEAPASMACHSDGELPDTSSLKKRLEHKLERTFSVPKCARFCVPMELNLLILGEACPTTLEKVCLHASEDSPAK